MKRNEETFEKYTKNERNCYMKKSTIVSPLCHVDINDEFNSLYEKLIKFLNLRFRGTLNLKECDYLITGGGQYCKETHKNDAINEIISLKIINNKISTGNKLSVFNIFGEKYVKKSCYFVNVNELTTLLMIIVHLNSIDLKEYNKKYIK